MKDVPVPHYTVREYEAELARRQSGNTGLNLVKRIVITLVTVAAAAVLVAYLWFPVMSVNGTSMEPVFNDGDVILAIRDVRSVKRGDIIAFYYNDRVLLKRVIALPGETVTDIDDDGNVYIDGVLLDEPYLSRGKAKGICDVTFPVEVTENSFFVMGDNRDVSVDSRSVELRNVYFERVVGKIIFRVFPFSSFGTVK